MNARETELRSVMIAALDGDAAAYRSLLAVLVPGLRAFFRRRVGREDVAEDLVQETLIAVHAKRSTYDRERPFTAWLFAIARYKLADHLRRSGRHGGVDDIGDEIRDRIESPEFEESASAAIDVSSLLDRLPAKQRDAIRATRLEGYSLSEAAARSGISPADAKISVYRGLKRLAARVQGRVK